MKTIFADTSFYLATISSRDSHHAQAIALAAQIQGKIVTTDFVLVEIANFLSAHSSRQAFLSLLDDLQTDHHTTIITASHELFLQGVELFRQRQDKEWSLTDCISFVVMQENKLHEALTSDHHFEQAGFIPLMT